MEVILLERVGKLGQIGDVVRVRDGYGRNFLLAAARRCARPRPTARSSRRSAPISKPAMRRPRTPLPPRARRSTKVVVLIRQSGETGILYGSRLGPDIATALAADGMNVDRNQIHIAAPIKTLGLHKVRLCCIRKCRSRSRSTSPVRRKRPNVSSVAKRCCVREENSLDDLGLEIGAALPRPATTADFSRFFEPLQWPVPGGAGHCGFLGTVKQTRLRPMIHRTGL